MRIAKVLGIAGSPRRNGNTEFLLREFLRGAETSGLETELIILCKLNLSPCTSCDSCQKDGICVIRDDMQMMYKKLTEARFIVFASPIYFCGVSAQLKAFIDRCQSLWSKKYILRQPILGPEKVRRKGFFISTAGTPGNKKVFAGAIATVKAIFHVLEIEYTGELLYPGMEKKDAILTHPTEMQEAYSLGLSLGKDQ
ncbi:MAG: flavodoxin family protein [Candidatus Scalindua sp. AMX11]|nr:MAG: flavodoxin family protein [Candidatus Scalindua sp.]NOG84894.1 flavodoxin family protein [Planctomycetota bacterium]RZV84961.1 MAG: flavodoxin family protein [Candidatus Scalindua sp. SCAELEC01]TDE65045.1 MAG: flavodoxin family protein [Candidatus Scalindua sp. AMX11]GJQ59437.1 MAG: FMN reductase [Candidatus Scalindua sp.]